MRAEKTVRLLLAAGLAVGPTMGLMTGCQNTGPNGSSSQGSSGDSKTNGGNGETSGNNAKGSGNGATKNAQTQGGSTHGSQLTEPAPSTNGQASGQVAADSDDGSPAAVGHQSVAMPGAPEPTVKDKQQPPPKSGQAPPQ